LHFIRSAIRHVQAARFSERTLWQKGAYPYNTRVGGFPLENLIKRLKMASPAFPPESVETAKRIGLDFERCTGKFWNQGLQVRVLPGAL
jgi:hypothetical protein